ncbi:MAG: ATP-dependent sacrificial sulfur transferase LarE [Candidatus Aureabacteria bacterium]|nr:ATP-dependent sacrificial sulfur transferase LarE [Candidatus Auribacterota bacterium]NLW94688.1 ATP-dependent sacrificial sulfur transferase LarE [Chlamydiota bacterium]HQM53154.1 ATP-dependent sacrificial sulfur transferase LarE [bacterium]
MNALTVKHERLKRRLASLGSLLVAYSGGVDSTLLLAVAASVLGRRLLAVTADSPTFPAAERREARRIARRLGVRHRVVRTRELEDPRFRENPADRCYWCKRGLLGALRAVAAREGIAAVALGSQRDDSRDYRPGERAAREMRALSPLRDAGFTRRDVRLLSRRLGLPGWDREPAACLASRIPYGRPIERAALRRVERAEELLRAEGFRRVRVRADGTAARIEVDPAQVGAFVSRRARLSAARALRRLGFTAVSVDLEGYRTGSLNEALGAKGPRRTRRGRR